MNDNTEVTLECFACRDLGTPRLFRGRPEVARARLDEHISVNGPHGKIQAPKR